MDTSSPESTVAATSSRATPSIDADARQHSVASSLHQNTCNTDAADDEASSKEPESFNMTRVGSNTIMREEDRNEIRRIATALSAAGIDNETGLDRALSEDPTLNPESSDFDLPKWLAQFMHQLRGDHQRVRPGVLFRDLDVSGSAPDLQMQATVSSVLLTPFRMLGTLMGKGRGNVRNGTRSAHKKILQNFNGVLRTGELLVVLGRPGSGCSTLLKTLTGELHGLHVDSESKIHYSGVPQDKMAREFRGEVIYNQEVDKHFPELTVGQTLEFAASVRLPAQRWAVGPNRKPVSRLAGAEYVARVAMAVCGLSHTYNTKVGSEFVRGVSGGERKRVSIAEMLVAGSPVMAWDNSTRGLDSATALKFVQTLRIIGDLERAVSAVAIYQASESIYELFEKATVLFEGRQIYFGPANAAKAYFERLGWECPARQTTGDF